MFNFYEVGGCVRDSLMGLKSNDIDYVAVSEDLKTDINTIYNDLLGFLTLEGYEIFLQTPHMYTIRARFPAGHINEGTVADFVLARKEIGYIYGTRRPILQAGTLYDDLARRDFTVNAIARSADGTLIDPFDGQEDIKNKILATPISGVITFEDDPLRLLRAIRFAITKGFYISPDIQRILSNFEYNTKFSVVSEERIREELHKCFKANTAMTLFYLGMYSRLSSYIFNYTEIWLEPTTKNR